jgi:hypothetical protein
VCSPFKGAVSKSNFSAPAALSACILEHGLSLNAQARDIPVAECSSHNEVGVGGWSVGGLWLVSFLFI